MEQITTPIANHNYPTTNICPILRQPIITEFTRPGRDIPDGFTYVIPGVNTKVVVFISNHVVGNLAIMERLAGEKDEIRQKLRDCRNTYFYLDDNYDSQ